MDETQKVNEDEDLNIDEHLETLDAEWLKQFAKEKALEAKRREEELHAHRANVEKWVKKVLDEKKELEKERGDVALLVQKEIAQQAVKTEVARTVAQLPEDVRAKFNEKFASITKGVELSPDDVHMYLADALKLIDLWREAIPAMWSSFMWTKPADKTDKRTPEQKEWMKQFLRRGA